MGGDIRGRGHPWPVLCVIVNKGLVENERALTLAVEVAEGDAAEDDRCSDDGDRMRRWDGSRTRPLETEFRHVFRSGAAAAGGTAASCPGDRSCAQLSHGSADVRGSSV